MHFVVRSFRSTFVEGRFTPLVAVLVMIGMRAALFHAVGLPQIVSHNDNYLWEPIAHFFAYPPISLLASTLSVFLVAWILSLINSRFNLLRTRSSLPFSTPLILLSLHPYLLVMTGNYVCILFVLSALFPLLDSYQQQDAYLNSFRAAVLIAMASLFQIYALVLLPLWWMGERSMRGPQFRSFIASLFGVFLVYVSLFSVYFFLDDIPRFMQPFLRFASFSLERIFDFSISEWIVVVFIGLFFISNMIFSIRIYSHDKVITLTLMRFVVSLIVVLLVFQLLYWEETFFFLLLSLALLSFLNAYFYSKTVSKNHIYMAYGMVSLILLICLSFIFSSM